MVSWTCNFLDFSTDQQPSVEMYRDYFLDFNPAYWNKGSCGASFVCQEDDGSQYSITMMLAPENGLCLLYSRRLNGIRDEFCSVGNPTKQTSFIEVGDNLYMPLGSVISPMDALHTLEVFFASPADSPATIQWRNTLDMIWPQ